MGDPSGIGPEIVVKALNSEEVRGLCDPVVYGSAQILEKASRLVGKETQCELIETGNFATQQLTPGKADEASGKASISYIERAVEAALKIAASDSADSPSKTKTAQ